MSQNKKKFFGKHKDEQEKIKNIVLEMLEQGEKLGL